ncbi:MULTISPECIES: sodium:alanine symporter family protein [Ruminococcus]|jgi:AGCS family alanine or glycine:cation symporter|uniref:alanine/glycine:cation symporter family protein n=1 Tax=Ruminococcus TaxID=1263 RepID=UPI0025F69C60|nr:MULTISPECIES: sodium:alanine symporter family protein [Ruminococcus]
MWDAISAVMNGFNDFLWGWFMIILLLGTHIFLTIRTKFVQRKTFKAIKLSVTKDPDSDGDISPFQALATALASTIGTGNIIGVGTAIALGGPGAVFWCWLTGVFGIATKYSESLIGVKYRVKTSDGRMLGGAMYALERGFKFKTLGKILAVLFALFALLASFGIGSGVQVNAISNIMNNTFDLGTVNLFGQDASVISIIVGVLVAAITAVVIFGGIKSISRVCELLVPFMAVFYVLGCLIILGMNFDVLGKTFEMIFQDAFSLKSVAGGFLGSSLMLAARYGIARGLFSNESGMGSAPIVASAAQTRNPVRQAMISSTGTFWDTVVVCLMTGLVLVSSIIKNPAIDVSDGGDLTYKAFQQIPVIGTPILVIGIAAFAYSTILGWSYYGERCVEYLFGRGGMIPYKLIFVFILLIGPVIKLDLVWTMADIFNALMSIPNLIAVVVLSPVVVKETNYYLYGNRLDEYDKTKIPVVNK